MRTKYLVVLTRSASPPILGVVVVFVLNHGSTRASSVEQLTSNGRARTQRILVRAAPLLLMYGDEPPVEDREPDRHPDHYRDPQQHPGHTRPTAKAEIVNRYRQEQEYDQFGAKGARRFAPFFTEDERVDREDHERLGQHEHGPTDK